MLEEFKDDVSSTRDRVEFRSDGTYELLPEWQPGKNKQRKDVPSANQDVASERLHDKLQSEVVLLDQNVIVL